MMLLKPSQPPIWNGIQPPRKTVAPMAQMMNILANSARKKKANLIPVELTVPAVATHPHSYMYTITFIPSHHIGILVNLSTLYSYV